MRRGAFVVGTVFATLLGAALLVTSARGSSVDPRRLVLQTSDVPAGFHLDRHSSRYFSNAAFGRGGPRLRKLVAKSGRITGYLAIYDHRVAPLVDTIYSRRSSGAPAAPSRPS